MTMPGAMWRLTNMTLAPIFWKHKILGIETYSAKVTAGPDCSRAQGMEVSRLAGIWCDAHGSDLGYATLVKVWIAVDGNDQ